VIAEGVATVNRLNRQGRREVRLDSRGAVAKANEEAVNESGVLRDSRLCRGSREPQESPHLPVLSGAARDTTFWKWDQRASATDQARGLDRTQRRHRLVVGEGGDDVRSEAGYQVVGKEFFEAQHDGLQSHPVRMLAQKPDAISVMASPAGSVGLIVKQARELGFKGRFVALHQIDSSVVAVSPAGTTLRACGCTGTCKLRYQKS